MLDQSHGLRFDIYERIYLSEELAGIAELEEVELIPDIRVNQREDRAELYGQLLLTGLYRGEDDRTERLEHAIPVEITIPLTRVSSLEDIGVEIENFDIDLLSARSVNITGVLSLRGIGGAAEPAPAWQQEEYTVAYSPPEETADAGREEQELALQEEGFWYGAEAEQTAGPADIESTEEGRRRRPGDDEKVYTHSWASAEGAEERETEQDEQYASHAKAEEYAAGAIPGEETPEALPPVTGSGPVSYGLFAQADPQAEPGPDTETPAVDPTGGWGRLSGLAGNREAAARSGEVSSAGHETEAPQPGEAEYTKANADEAAAVQAVSIQGNPEAQVVEEEFHTAQEIREEAVPANVSAAVSAAASAAGLSAPPADLAEPAGLPLQTALGAEESAEATPSAEEKPDLKIAVGSKKEPASGEKENITFSTLLHSGRVQPEQEDSGHTAETGDNAAKAAGAVSDNEWKSRFLSGREGVSPFRKVRLCIVQREETLDTIAERYQLSARELSLYNRLPGQNVEEGQVLYIP